MYPQALICLSPLSGALVASFPQVFESSSAPPVPNPILESQLLQSFSWLPTIPILALARPLSFPIELNPSWLQWVCKEAARRANQTLPLVSTYGGIVVLFVGKQRVKRGGSLIDNDKPQLSKVLHTKTYFSEWRVPICR